MDTLDQEVLFVGTAEAEHVEMYLKAIWHIKERGEDVKISSIAKMLNVRQPSVVQMLKKLNEQKLVNYNKAGVTLTQEGERIGSVMMRNSRRCLTLSIFAIELILTSSPRSLMCQIALRYISTCSASAVPTKRTS